MRILGIFTLISLVICVPLMAQADVGIVSGTVTDDTGGVIPGAEVTLNSVNTGSSVTTITSDEGFLEISDLQPSRNMTMDEVEEVERYLNKYPRIKTDSESSQ